MGEQMLYISVLLAVLPCLGPKQSLNPGAPQHHRQGLLHRSYRPGSRSLHSWLHLSYGGAGSPLHCRQRSTNRLTIQATHLDPRLKKDHELFLGKTLN